jgi:hypothetical protein
MPRLSLEMAVLLRFNRMELQQRLRIKLNCLNQLGDSLHPFKELEETMRLDVHPPSG